MSKKGINLSDFNHRLLYGNDGEIALVKYLEEHTNLPIWHRGVMTLSNIIKRPDIAEYIDNDKEILSALKVFYDTKSEEKAKEHVSNLTKRQLISSIIKEYYDGIKLNLVQGDIAIEWEKMSPMEYNGQPIDEKEDYVDPHNGIPYRRKYLKIDVKRGTFISQRSIDKYQGHFYALIPGGKIENISQTRIIRRGTVLKLYEDCSRDGCYHKPGKPYGLTKGPSGDLGIRITGSLRKEESINEFNFRLIKAKIAGEKFNSPRLWKQYLTFGDIDLEEIQNTIWE